MEPFLGEIRMFGFGWVPEGFAACNGNVLPYNQNAALYSLISTTYGGTAGTNFALPDLRGRTPVDIGQRKTDLAYVSFGQKGGTETVTLLSTNVYAHTHSINVQTVTADKANPSGNVLTIATTQAGKPTTNLYLDPSSTTPATPTTVLYPATLGAAGNSVAHPNLQPYQVTNFCIAITGIYPPRS